MGTKSLLHLQITVVFVHCTLQPYFSVRWSAIIGIMCNVCVARVNYTTNATNATCLKTIKAAAYNSELTSFYIMCLSSKFLVYANSGGVTAQKGAQLWLDPSCLDADKRFSKETGMIRK